MSESDVTMDLILGGGDVVNGDGVTRIRADVGIRGDRIVAIGDLSGAEARERCDVSGLIVCPGFVDIHAHADLMTLAFPEAVNKIQQGITTEIVGNCGSGIAPLFDRPVLEQVREAQSSIDVPGLDWDWTDVTGYLDRVDSVNPAVSVAVLVGHLPLRAGVVGFDQRPATSAEIERMQSELDRMLGQGAVGMSFGLMRPPSTYATPDEMVALGQVIARHDALMAVHMRDYGSGLLAAVDEMLDVAERAECRLQISHLTVVGAENWGAVNEAMEAIDAAATRGLDVAFDIYPYLAGSTSLSQKAPRWAMDGGMSGLRARLADPVARQRIVDEMSAGDPRWDWTLLAYVPQDETLNGSTVEEAATRRGVASIDLVLELLAVSDPVMVAFGRSEDDLRAVLSHPRSMIGTDGLVVLPPETSGGSLPHPRAFGAYPGFFQRYVREQGTVSLERAVEMCTSAPASRVRLSDRGHLSEGARADVVVFDADRIAETSTYTEPRRAPVGIEQVVANGVRVVAEGKITGLRGNHPVRAASQA
jgi:N-acyl-D-amino-acid deacylase